MKVIDSSAQKPINYFMKHTIPKRGTLVLSMLLSSSLLAVSQQRSFPEGTDAIGHLDQRLYLAVKGEGMMISDDQGGSWQKSSILAINPSTDKVMSMVTVGEELYVLTREEDHSTVYRLKQDDWQGNAILENSVEELGFDYSLGLKAIHGAVYLHPLRASFLYHYTSDDSWQRIDLPQHLNDDFITGYGEGSGSTVLVSTHQGRILAYNTAQKNWEVRNDRFFTAKNHGELYHLERLSNGTLAAAGNHGLFISTSEGLSWEQRSQDCMRSIQSTGSELVASIPGKGVFQFSGPELTTQEPLLTDEDFYAEKLHYSPENELIAGTHISKGSFVINGNKTSETETANTVHGLDKAGAEVYPNPATDEVNVQFYGNDTWPESISMTIYDISGKPVLRQQITPNASGSARLSVTELPTGYYTIQFQETSFDQSINLIKL